MNCFGKLQKNQKQKNTEILFMEIGMKEVGPRDISMLAFAYSPFLLDTVFPSSNRAKLRAP